MSVRLMVGADPELFVKEKATGRFVSAHDLLPGTKTDPYKVTSGAIQVDGVAAEFNIDPSRDHTEFTSSITRVMDELQKHIGDKYELVSDPSVVFPEEYFHSLPEEVRELGCNPDFNAWTGQVNDRPDGSSTTMRTGAGHIHVGWTKDVDPTDSVHFEDCRIIARQLDYYLGLYSLMWDPDMSRRSLYGKAGSFRPKPYGVEYRPLSNMWLRSPRLQSWVFNAAYKGVSDLIDNGVNIEEEFKELAREVIDNSQVWWTEESWKDKNLKRLGQSLMKHTGLKNPPPLPKPGDPKLVLRPKAKTLWKNGVGNCYARVGVNGGLMEDPVSGKLVLTDTEGFVAMPEILERFDAKTLEVSIEYVN